MRDNRSHMAIRIDALQRFVMINLLSGKLPIYLVTEYPKSGGSWVAQMLSEYLRLPFIRNRRPPILAPTACVFHGHYLYGKRLKNTLVVVRDGRDVMVSAYYHFLFHNDKNPPWTVEQFRKKLQFSDYDNITENLPLFIEYMFVVHSQGMFRFSWTEFLQSWMQYGVLFIKYEDLLNGAEEALAKALVSLTGEDPDYRKIQEIVQKYSFENLAKRKPGQENVGSFLRKGIAGDWKNKFSRRACEVFDKYGGEMLISLGYEKDNSWIKERC